MNVKDRLEPSSLRCGPLDVLGYDGVQFVDGSVMAFSAWLFASNASATRGDHRSCQSPPRDFAAIA